MVLGWLGTRLRAALLVLAVLATGTAMRPRAAVAQAQPQTTCSRADFEAVVDDAGSTLRTLAAQNRPAFQDKLRQLREKRKWAQDVFMKQAAPFVRDPTIISLDQKSSALLERINSLGEGANDGGAPDCSILIELRASFKAMVAAQSEKWSYMFAKIDAELAK